MCQAAGRGRKERRRKTPGLPKILSWLPYGEKESSAYDALCGSSNAGMCIYGSYMYVLCFMPLETSVMCVMIDLWRKESQEAKQTNFGGKGSLHSQKSCTPAGSRQEEENSKECCMRGVLWASSELNWKIIPGFLQTHWRGMKRKEKRRHSRKRRKELLEEEERRKEDLQTVGLRDLAWREGKEPWCLEMRHGFSWFMVSLPNIINTTTTLI